MHYHLKFTYVFSKFLHYNYQKVLKIYNTKKCIHNLIEHNQNLKWQVFSFAFKKF